MALNMVYIMDKRLEVKAIVEMMGSLSRSRNTHSNDKKWNKRKINRNFVEEVL